MGKILRQKALLLLALLDDSLSTCWSAWTFPSASINATTIGRPRSGLPLTSLGGSCRPACWRLVIWLGAPYRTCERHPTTATASWSEAQLETHHHCRLRKSHWVFDKHCLFGIDVTVLLLSQKSLTLVRHKHFKMHTNIICL